MKMQVSLVVALLLLGTIEISANEDDFTEDQIEQQVALDREAEKIQEEADRIEREQEFVKEKYARKEDQSIRMEAELSDNSIEPEGLEGNTGLTSYGKDAGTKGFNSAYFGGNAGNNAFENPPPHARATNNSFFGYNSGKSVHLESENSFFGSRSGENNTADDNSFFGFQSGISNTTGTRNVFVGSMSGGLSTTGSHNTFIGDTSGYSNKDKSNNTFIGSLSGYSNTDGYKNTFIGSQSGNKNTSGERNTFIGYESAYTNTKGFDNVIIGYKSAYSNTDGNDNVFNGNYSGYKNTSGGENVFVGHDSGFNNTTGSYNTFVGYRTGRNTRIDHSVLLGNNAGYSANRNNVLYIANSSTNTPLVYGEFDNDIVRVNGTFETKWSGSNTVGDGLTNLMILEASNTEEDKTSDTAFVLRNGRTGKQWNFRTTKEGKGFAATINGTGGTEFEIVNDTNDYRNAKLYIGGKLVFANGKIQAAVLP